MSILSRFVSEKIVPEPDGQTTPTHSSGILGEDVVNRVTNLLSGIERRSTERDEQLRDHMLKAFGQMQQQIDTRFDAFGKELDALRRLIAAVARAQPPAPAPEKRGARVLMYITAGAAVVTLLLLAVHMFGPWLYS